MGKLVDVSASLYRADGFDIYALDSILGFCTKFGIYLFFINAKNKINNMQNRKLRIAIDRRL